MNRGWICLTSAVALFLCAAAIAQEADPASSPQTIFFRANTRYQEGAYADAVREYGRLLQSGVHSGPLYFNLGNAYFKLGETGKAIAYYERARRFIPRDPDLEANLAYARSQAGVDPCLPPVWQRILFPLRGRFPAWLLAWLTSAGYSGAVFLLVVHRLSMLPRRPVLWGTGILAGLALVACVSLAAQLLEDEWPAHAVVVGAAESPARFEPAADGTVHFSLPQGSKVRVTDMRGGWLQIARCDGRRGWMMSSSLEIL